MAVAFRGVSATPATAAADPAGAATLPASTVSGDLVLDMLGWKYPDVTTIAAQPTNWADPTDNESANGGAGAAGNDSGLVRGAIWSREYDGVWTMPTVDMTPAAPNTLIHHGISFSKGAGEVWEPVVTGYAVDTTGSTTLVDPPLSQDIPLAPGDFVVAMWVLNGDVGTMTVPATYSASGATIASTTNRSNIANIVGQDMRMIVDTFTVTAGTVTVGIDSSLTMSAAGANTAGVVVFARVRATTPAASFSPSFHTHPQRRYAGRYRR